MNRPNIKIDHLQDGKYFKSEFHKTQIVLHHTAGGNNPKAAWNASSSCIATAYYIDRAGLIYEMFDPKYWAWHLGLKTANNAALNSKAIGIEMCSWGGLKEENGKYYADYPKVNGSYTIPVLEDVVSNSFRGYNHFQDYTENQVKSLEELVEYLCEEFSIPKNGMLKNKVDANAFLYDQKSVGALAGIPGIYTHVNYRTDKSDCFPSQILINALNELR